MVDCWNYALICNIIIDSLCKGWLKKLKRLRFEIQENDLKVKKNNCWIMSFLGKKKTIGLCLSLKKNLEAKSEKKKIWKQADNKNNENEWICIEEIMMLVDDNCL